MLARLVVTVEPPARLLLERKRRAGAVDLRRGLARRAAHRPCSRQGKDRARRCGRLEPRRQNDLRAGAAAGKKRGGQAVAATGGSSLASVGGGSPHARAEERRSPRTRRRGRRRDQRLHPRGKRRVVRGHRRRERLRARRHSVRRGPAAERDPALARWEVAFVSIHRARRQRGVRRAGCPRGPRDSSGGRRSAPADHSRHSPAERREHRGVVSLDAGLAPRRVREGR